MKKNFIKIVLLAAILAPQFPKAQTVVIDGEIRPRIEDRDGVSKPLLTTNDLGISAIQRTRLGATFTSGLLSSQITIQDSRTFGQNPNA